MASTTKSNNLAQSNGHPPLRIRLYRPSDWEHLKPIFVAGVKAAQPAAVRHMYTWPRFYPVYALVGGGVAWLGRGVWNVAHRLGLQAFRTEHPWSWVRHIGRGVIKNWGWKEGAALGFIGLGLVTWGVVRWQVDQVFHGYTQMSLKSDLEDIPKHYRLEKIPLPEPNGQGEWEEWKPEGVSAFWVAEIGDEVVGCIALDQKDDDACVSAGELRRMSVSSTFHRRGIASRLINQLLDHAKNHGLKEVYLYTTQYQAAAVAMYKKAGFKLVKGLPLISTARLLMYKLDL